jgi:hypothetical protein
MSLMGLQLDRRSATSAVVVTTIYRGQGIDALRGHDISWPKERGKFARFRASSFGCEEYSDGGSESLQRHGDLR